MGPGGNKFPRPDVYEKIPDLVAPESQFNFFHITHTVTTVTFDPETDSVSVLFLDPLTEELLYTETLKMEELF